MIGKRALSIVVVPSIKEIPPIDYMEYAISPGDTWGFLSDSDNRIYCFIKKETEPFEIISYQCDASMAFDDLIGELEKTLEENR